MYYAQKQEVRDTYIRKKDPDLSIAGYRTNVDWMVYDAFSAIRLIEEFGEQLEHDRSLGLDGHASPIRTDLCECHNVIKCPNGTSSPIGASSLNDCKPCCSGVAGESPEMCYTSETTTCRKTGSAMVLRRYDLIPSHAVDDYNATNFVIKAPVDASEASKLQAPFNFWCVAVGARCGSLQSVDCISRRSCPSLSLSEGRGAEIARLTG